MTNEYVEQAVSSPPQIFGSGKSSSAVEPPAPLHWRTFKLPKEDPDAETWIGWELKIDDLRGGYLQYGDFGRGTGQYDGDYRMTSVAAGVDPRWRRHLILSQLKTRTYFTTYTPADKAIFHTILAGQLVFGGGSTANRALFKELPISSPGTLNFIPGAVTYTPATDITGLYTGIIGGATTAEQMFVCMAGTAIDVHSVPGTSAGSMHANTTAASGVLMSPVNASTPGTPTLLIYANNSMYTLPVSSAIGAAPTQVMSGLPNGGTAIQIEQVEKNWPLRAYWIMPHQNRTTPWATARGSGTTAVAQVYHTNLEGTDRQLVPLPIPTVYAALFWNHKLIATDGYRIVAWDGDTAEDLGILNNRVDGAARIVREIGVFGENLYALVSLGGSAFTLELYIPEFKSWVPISASWTENIWAVTADSSGPYIWAGFYTGYHKTLPVSPNSGRTYVVGYVDGTNPYIEHMKLPQPGHNLFYDQVVGAQNPQGNFESTGTWDSPYFSLPTLEGREKRVDQIVFGGQVAEGNVQVTINPNQGGSAVTFAGTDTVFSQPADSGEAPFDLLQVRIKLTQGANAYKTPQGLPVTIRGRARLNDPVEELAQDYI